MTVSDVNIGRSGPVQVRIAERADAESIVTVINSAFRLAEEFFVNGDRIDLAGVLHFLEIGKFALAHSEGQLLGCVYFEPRRNPPSETRNPTFSRAYLGLLAVDPARQHSGLGSLLMEVAEDYCRGLSCQFMDIKIVSLRQDLPDFYRRRGYVETGTSSFPTDVKTKVPCHFINMSKPLNPVPIQPSV